MDKFRLEMAPRDANKAVPFLLDYIESNLDMYTKTPEDLHVDAILKGNIIDACETLILANKIAKLEFDLSEFFKPFKSNFPHEPLSVAIKQARSSVKARNILDYFSTTREKGLEGGPVFVLNADDANRIAKLAFEMKDIVNNSTFFDDDHKKRLIDRIGQIEIEVHKKVGRLDVILGGLVDIGDAFGQFGEKVKPLVDRIREIRGIAQSKSDEYAKLPPPDEVKKLPAPDKAKADA